MQRLLRQIYDDLSRGRLSQAEALAKIKAMKQQERDGSTGLVLAVPVWHSGKLETDANVDTEYGQHCVLLCDQAAADAATLSSLLPGSHCISLGAEEGDIAQRYTRGAMACFGQIKTLFRDNLLDKILVQVVVAESEERVLAAGLSGLLTTATLENPRLTGQVILIPPDLAAEELACVLKEEKARGGNPLVRYQGGARQILGWQEMQDDAQTPPVVFKDSGVYLITGGRGGLGILFAKEIIAQSSQATVVLTGRSELSAEEQARLNESFAPSSRVTYRQLDLSDLGQVRQLITSIRDDYGRLDGILHCAGMVADNFILKKPTAEFRDVLAPKVTGTVNLDQASHDVELDFFVLFSSAAGVLGNLGQADYATANGFMDRFAAYRNRQVAAKQRYGRTRSIGWALWQDGGIKIDPASQERLRQTIGMHPLQTATAMRAFYRSLTLPDDQILVVEGDLALMRRALAAGRPISPEPLSLPAAAEQSAVADPHVAAMTGESLIEKTEDYLRRQCAQVLKLPPRQIDPQSALEQYGIDSIVALKLVNQLEKSFGPLSKTLFFEYQSLRALAGYFTQSHAARSAALFRVSDDHQQQAVGGPSEPPGPVTRMASRRAKRGPRVTSRQADSEAIAIIGLSGRYPEAVDIEEYWRNLREGKDCIIEVPKERWDWREYFSEDRTQGEGYHYSKWGGFISGVDQFDPLFFNISPKEAKILDPQERLFLQHAWMAVEDAGYTRAGLQTPTEGDLPGQVGVYVGVMYTEYQLFGAEASARGKRLGVVGSAASIANRVSYALNLHGPSMTLDTMCSSSLTAIHVACQDLKQGRTSLAIAGGVNVSIHPNKYLVLSGGQFISSDGHCQSFGEGGDGYIPGEGVGVVVLKRLSEAKRDGDHIYGVIRGSALNHGGKTNGYSVPNPQAQATAISRALAESQTDARHISYIEAHGTGTKLGDPIEIAALSKAFEAYTKERGYCLIGSAKSNIGHCESAAGIAGLTKVLLQMQHQQIAPSLHSEQLNPHIDFGSTPFVVNQTLKRWEQPVIDGRTMPRIAGISSFGAGGSNAHVIVEEYEGPVPQPMVDAPVVIVLSARTAEQLQQKARDLLEVVQPRLDTLDLAAVAYTLQTGREAMDQRLGLIVSSVEQLTEKLQAYVEGKQDIEDAYQGEVKRNKEALSIFSTEADLQQTIDRWILNRKLAKLVNLWAKGVELDWSKLYGDAKPRRVSLPTYPFAKERFWIDVDTGAVIAARGAAAAVLHPLLHSNTSNLSQQSYSSTFTGVEFFLKEYKGVFPPSAYLEMARAAIEHAWPVRPESTVLELHDVVWAQPIVISNKPINIALWASGPDQIEYEVYGEDAGQEIVHCQGRALRSVQAPHAVLDLARLGPGSMARLQLPKSMEKTSRDYVLHPTLMEGALEACAALFDGRPRLPFALESLRIVSACTNEMAAWVRYAPGSQAANDVVKLDIDLSDVQGKICAELRGVSWRLAPAGVVEPSREKAQPAPLVTAVRREIRVVLEASPVAVEQEKRGTISLAAKGPRVLTQPSAGRAPVTLSDARLGRTSSSAASPVRLYDDGNGIFSIHISAGSRNVVAQLLRVLERVRQEASLKVLSISGVERGFPRGGSDEYNEAVEQKLYDAIVSFPAPVIAVLQGDTIGPGFLFAALCDFMVCNEEATYGYTDAGGRFYPTAAEAALFSERFGDVLTGDLLSISTASTGRQLRAKGWTCPIVPAARVETHARKLASTLAMKTQDALRLLKQHLTRHLAGLVGGLTWVEPTIDDEPRAVASPIASPAPHIHLDTSVEHVLVIEFGQARAEELLGDLRDVFAQLRRGRYYKAAVISSEVLEFLPGDIPDDLVPEFERVIAEAEIPIVAALEGNAKGNGWLIAQLCDACVYNRQGVYSSADAGQAAAAIFAHRFGNDAGKEILLTGADYSGADLQRRIGTVLVAEQSDVLSQAIDVASYWASLPWPTLGPARQSRVGTTEEITYNESPELHQLTAPASIALHSPVVCATAHPGGIVVVTMEDRQAKNMFSDALIEGLTEAFTHIEQTPYKVVILTGYDQYFASGGTKESLLAVQAGKAKFTDTKVFQLALDCKVPVIAAMQGHGIGAGWCLGMSADLVLLSEESRYVSPYMDYGFTPGAGATWILGHKMGQDLARESLLTAQSYTGRELKERCPVLRVMPRAEVESAAMALARRIAQRPRYQLVGFKQRLTANVRERLEETYRLELAMHEKTFVGRPDTLAQIESNFYQEIETAPAAPLQPQIEPARRDGDGHALLAVRATLKTLLANELQMRESDIDEEAQFIDLGLDSVAGITWIRKINETYQTSIDPTKVYSYSTLAKLSLFVKEEAERIGTLSGAEDAPVTSSLQKMTTVPAVGRPLASRRSRTASRFANVGSAQAPALSQPIAIIGMAGQFPQAMNIDELWRNLAEGKNCITRVPRERWDVNAYYKPGDPVAGKTYCQSFGALEEYDLFDPLFFNISPTEAEHMDPQQRLFLQASWHSIEHAGYDARALSGSKCGVFVGCAASDYLQASPGHQLSAHGFTGSASSVLAARISYFLNLQGPCVSIDTACSSSLVAIAQACDSLTSGASDLALAGGVYVMGGPAMHIRASQAGMLSPQGKCFTFDQRADGFVPGEGVGVIVLKRLADAERDRDVIYGVVQGWGINQDGRTNGITSPNPESQTRLEQEVYDKYGIDPAKIQLIEAHGTGTKLGDPIEVEGLKQAFKKYTQAREYCALGSVKSNIGHCLTAAGMAGAIKILLALKHKQLPPTINFERLNEHIDLTDSPFYVNTRLQEWDLQGAPRRQAAISSFGFSGTNAHLVIGEYLRPTNVERVAFTSPRGGKTIVPLSARTAEQLRQKAGDLLEFIRTATVAPDLTELAYTLQVGRAAMDERLGFLVTSVEQLTEKLQAYVDGAQRIDDVHQGHVKRNKEALSLLTSDSDLRKTIDQWITDRKLPKLVDLWAKGLDVDWNALYGDGKPGRISLPVYPFAKERYWIAQKASPAMAPAAPAVLHPLLHTNVSDLNGQRYRSTFTGSELFLAGHEVASAACLEMARAAIEHAWGTRLQPGVLELHGIVWAAPIAFNTEMAVNIALSKDPSNGRVDYEIYSEGAGEEIVHCQGSARLSGEPVPGRLDLEQLKRQTTQRDEQLLTTLRLPEGVETLADYVLHPSLLDGALQAAMALGERAGMSGRRFVSELRVLRVISPCTARMAAWMRYGDAAGNVDIDLCDEHGNICAQLRGLSLKVPDGVADSAAVPGPAAVTLIATPTWQASELEAISEAKTHEYAQHHVVLSELADVHAAKVRATFPYSNCVSLEGAQENIARRYEDYALACFEQMQAILQSTPRGNVLVQLAIADHQEHALIAGLSGLLKTAAREHSRLTGQVILVSPQATPEELTGLLQNEKSHGLDALVRYKDGARQVLRWKQASEESETAPIVFREQGVYLITGGLGGLGLLFAKEILTRARHARVILTGRSVLTAKHRAVLETVRGQGGQVNYRQLDLGDSDQVNRLMEGIRDEYGQLNGILHCAGMLADNFIVKKTAAEFNRVLAPKVTGTLNLDLASKDVDLDFFVLFSSIAAATGNVGQADYAAANGFMDQFAAYRNGQAAAGQRRGRTRSINWSLWQAGGMRPDPATLELARQTTGLQPISTAAGMEAFYRSLALPCDRILVVEGIQSAMEAYLQREGMLTAAPYAEPAPDLPQRYAPHESAAPRAARAHFDTPLARDELQRRLKNSLGAVLRIEAPLIDIDQAFSELGLDSFLGTELIIAINREYGLALPNVEVFNYPTVRELAVFLEQEIGKLPRRAKPAPAPLVPTVSALPANGGAHLTLKRKTRRTRVAPTHSEASDDRIAIIGMSGRYPQANDLSEYWNNLVQGKNSVTEVPRERWDVRLYYDAGPAKRDSKWLGAVDDIDCFDSLFFRISPQEAECIDPQHRLFLQEAYRAFEDAGYSSSTLGNTKCGVYLGISTNEYAHLLSRGKALANASVTSNSSAIAAARIAYHLNLKGPAIAIDTACSSSLVAVHLGCQALARHETDMALAGGVTLWLSPESYRRMSQAGMFAADGRCKTFDDSADGIVNADGVGAVVLKRLADAQKDNDFIYGVILGSGINQDGRTNGITAPSVKSQIALEREVYAKYGIDPATISYVETHGTGTKLGDPIELVALSTVFRENTDRKNFCALGSVKSNIGHTTAAAGVAGVQKVVLSMQHQTLVPTLHVKKENTRFDFKDSPFYISLKTEPWNVEPGFLRRAAVSSFGYSGTNAHLVIEEYPMPAEKTVSAGERTPVIVPLSAKSAQQLRQRAQDLLTFIRTARRPVDLVSLAHTLQTGREHMEERLGFEVTSVDQLAERLAAYLAGDKRIEGAHQGHAESSGEGMAIIDRDDDMQEAIDRWIARGKLSKLLELWVRGGSFDWKKLYSGPTPQRISLPTYPFAKERCWFDAPPGPPAPDDSWKRGGDVKAIEDIISQIGDDLIDTEDAVAALKMLV